MSAVEKIFEEAASDFAQRLSQKELESFKRTTYAHVKQEILKIQHDGETFKNMRNLNRLRSFLEAMEQYSKVIEVFLNVNQFVGLVWGPLKFLLQVRSPGSIFSPSAVFASLPSYWTARKLHCTCLANPLANYFATKVASSYVDSFDCLLDAYERIGKELPLLEQYSELFGQEPDMRTALGYIFKNIIDFHKRALRFFTGRGMVAFLQSALIIFI